MQSLRLHRALAAVLLLYAAIETAYVVRLPLVMDEFDGAYEAYRLRHALPYRDFQPYKTVLGYYIEAVPALVDTSVWSRLMAMKIELVAINTLMLGAAAIFMRRFVRPRAIVIALLLLVICSTFLERSAELRVDMLTAWAGLWSLLLLLENRFAAAGALAGVSFLVSQKGAFYILAAAAALLALAVMRRQVRGAFVFGACASAVVIAYVGVWSLLAPPGIVLQTTFSSAAHAIGLNLYEIRGWFWSQILRRDPMYFVVAALALWALARRRHPRDVAVCAYAAVVIAAMAAYPEPWPYVFVLMFPTLWVLHAFYLDAEEERMPRWLKIAIAAGCIVYPAHRVFVALSRSSAYQKYNVSIAEAILHPRDVYLAGMDLVHDREQSPPELSRLVGSVMAALRRQPPEALTAMIATLRQRPPKLLIGNARVYNLPPPLLHHLLDNYTRLTGSVWSYAPLVRQSGVVRVAFSDRYRVDAETARSLSIDGQRVANDSFLHLEAGDHVVDVDGRARLRLMPADIERHLDARFTDEEDLFPHVYDY